MKLINFKRLSAKCGDRSRSSFQRDMESRGFPRPILQLGRTPLWDEDEVDKWLEELAKIPYLPEPVAVPKEGNRRGRKSKKMEATNET